MNSPRMAQQKEIERLVAGEEIKKEIRQELTYKDMYRSINTHYEEELKSEGIDRILKYGIACYKKRCKVQLIGEKEE